MSIFFFFLLSIDFFFKNCFALKCDEWGYWDVCCTCGKPLEDGFHYYNHYDGEDHDDIGLIVVTIGNKVYSPISLKSQWDNRRVGTAIMKTELERYFFKVVPSLVLVSLPSGSILSSILYKIFPILRCTSIEGISTSIRLSISCVNSG